MHSPSHARASRLAKTAEGEAAILLRQLIRRFGPLSPNLLKRVKSADAEHLKGSGGLGKTDQDRNRWRAITIRCISLVPS